VGVRGRNLVLRAEQQEQIRQLRERKVSISEIARECGIDRKTVRALLLHGPPGLRTTRSPRPSPLDPFKPYLKARVAQIPLSAVRLLEEIQARGYTGQYGLVKNFVRPLRQGRSLVATLRYETDPGVQAQVDFGHFGTIEEDGERHHLYAFSMVLGYSRCRYVEFLTHINTPNLIHCHLNAFAYFGGFPDEVLYDNMTQVVLERALRTEDSKWNPQFLDFSRHLGFRIRLCWPRRPQTKGKIESTIKFVRGNFFLGRSFVSLSDVNRQSVQWCHRVNTERVHRETGVLPIERLEEEHLHPLEGRPAYELIRREYRRVDRECYVSYLTNRYSVHWRYAGRHAELQIQGEKVRILIDHVEVATHDLLPAGMGAKAKVKEHFVGLGTATRQRNLDQFLRTHPPESLPVVERRPLAEYDALLEKNMNENSNTRVQPSSTPPQDPSREVEGIPDRSSTPAESPEGRSREPYSGERASGGPP
jgi:transposase